MMNVFDGYERATVEDNLQAEVIKLKADLAAARAEIERLNKETLSFHAQATDYYEETERLKSELDKWRNGLLSLLPAGTEFYNDVDRCINYVRERVDGYAELSKRHFKGRRKVDADLEAVKAENKKFRELIEAASGFVYYYAPEELKNRVRAALEEEK